MAPVMSIKRRRQEYPDVLPFGSLYDQTQLFV